MEATGRADGEARTTRGNTTMMQTIRTALVLALAMAATTLLPSSAQALGLPAGTGIAQDYHGWAYARHHCPGTTLVACTADYQVREAWHWNGHGWRRSGIGEGTRVYAWPYATGWHWAWTARTGWLAMRSSDITYHR